MKYDLITENWYSFLNEEVTTSPLAPTDQKEKPAETTTGQSEEEKRQAQKDTMLGSFENQLHDLSTTAKKLGFASTELKAALIQKINDLIKESKKKKAGDRCTRIAKRKYKVWPSAYASGAVVKCRQGKIWKGISENATDEEIDHALLLEQLESIEVIEEKWSEKYKRSINCKHPKGFSQKAHCQGRKKNEELELEKSGGYISESKKKVNNNLGNYEEGKKYNGEIPEIRFLPINVIKRQEYDFRPETLKVSDDVAKKMDFSQPIEVTAYRFPVTGWSSTIPPKIVHLSEEEQIDDTKPDVMLIDGHHRLAAAIQTGRSWLPVKVSARNAKGEKLNELIQLSQNVEKQHNKSINEKKDYKPSFTKEKEQGLHGWFARNKGKGWVNCRTGGPCGRSDADEGGKYPACRPTKAQCKSAGKGPLRKKKSSKPISWTKKKKKD